MWPELELTATYSLLSTERTGTQERGPLESRTISTNLRETRWVCSAVTPFHICENVDFISFIWNFKVKLAISLTNVNEKLLKPNVSTLD